MSDPLAVLTDPGYEVPHVPAADHGVGWLRANVARFCDGDDHTRRRALTERLLAAVRPQGLRANDGGDPIELLAQALGLLPAAAADVRTVAACYQPHLEITAEADAALGRLLAACGGIADEPTAARIGVLVQAAGALDALIAGTNPPVAVTRRTAPTGETVEVDLAGLAFGAGRHACPGRDHALALTARAFPFHRLHYAEDPLILPNVWDYATAAALADAGFSAIGTTSLGVAAATGVPDASGLTLQQTLDLAARLVRLPVPITVDIESGFGADPGELAAQLSELGVAGVNLEDGRGDRLAGPAEQVALLRAFKDAAPAIFLNARIDTYWLGVEQQTTIARAQRYAAAGADGIFVPDLVDDHEITTLASTVDLPLNVLAQPYSSRLRDLGVRRISAGSLLFRSAIAAAVTTAQAVRDGAPIPVAPSYEAIQALIKN